MPDLYQELIKLADSEMYPFHMPGHKRNEQSTPLKGAFRCDITEIDGFDNLHGEEGIILEAEKRAAKLYGSGETFFLINGSTSGVLSAISAAVSFGGTILAGRGSHRSFYHAAYLRHLNIEYLPAKIMDKYGIFDGFSEEDVENALKDTDKKVEAVFITSPTYEGRCSDVEGIAKVCHRRGIPLIVDAAHGAHFGFGDDIPESAVHQGADIVINSVHKTLPAMTQTALIHVQGDIVDKCLLKRFLTIYQSSSPSYVLMSSIDLCIREMQDNSKQYTQALLKYRKMLQDAADLFQNLLIPSTLELQDPAKVLIYTGFTAMTGQKLYDILREDYSLQLEMAGEKYALAIITGWDTDEGIERLIKALKEIDEGYGLTPNSTERKSINRRVSEKSSSTKIQIPQKRLSLYEAWDLESEIVPLEKCAGRIAGGFINLYPPGIPLIVPGEVIDESLIKNIKKYEAENLNVQGLENKKEENKGIIVKRGFLCVKQK